MTDDRIEVREATTDELAAVLGVLDAAALETGADRIRDCIDTGDVLVAVPVTTSTSTGPDGETNPNDETLVGALVLDGNEIVNIAVRPRRRGQGIGTALVEAAVARRDCLVAEFDASVRPFYESLGFEVTPADGPNRLRGVYRAG